MKHLIILLSLLLTSVCGYSQNRVFTMYKGYNVQPGHDPIPWTTKETVKVSDYGNKVFVQYFNNRDVCYSNKLCYYEKSDSKGKYYTKKEKDYIVTWYISNDLKIAIYTFRYTGTFSNVWTTDYYYSTMSAAQNAANSIQTRNRTSRSNSSNSYDSRGGRSNNPGSGSGSSSDYGTCHTCHGSGKCNMCAGRGETRNPYNDRMYDCSWCKGRGICYVCHGKGKL